MAYHILIADDEADILQGLTGILEDEGYRITVAADPQGAIDGVRRDRPDLILLDIWFQNNSKDGLWALGHIVKNDSDIPVVMMSGHGTIETAVQAIKNGAYDFIEKPFKTDRLLQVIGRALEAKHLRAENRALRASVGSVSDFTGSSAAMNAVRLLLDKIAATNSRALITGEAGVGKDVAARYIHAHSARAEYPFVVVSCATLHPDHFEAELFGVEGTSNQPGLLERAQGGTLFLDEVADMPFETQGKILRVLQEQVFHRLGGSKPISVDLRVLSSTSKDLAARIREGRFREELFYRLNVVAVSIPALRERRGDIRGLADDFLRGASLAMGRSVPVLSAAALSLLQSYDWPGNVRQLKNILEGVVILRDGASTDPIAPDHFPPEITGDGLGTGADPVVSGLLLSLPLKEARDRFEHDYLVHQLGRFDGSVSRTAQFIGMERSALHRKLKSLGVTSRDEGGEAADLADLRLVQTV